MWGYVKERVVKARPKIINELKLEIERESRFINNDLCGTAIKKGECKSASRDEGGILSMFWNEVICPERLCTMLPTHPKVKIWVLPVGN